MERFGDSLSTIDYETEGSISLLCTTDVDIPKQFEDDVKNEVFIEP